MTTPVADRHCRYCQAVVIAINGSPMPMRGKVPAYRHLRNPQQAVCKKAGGPLYDEDVV